MRGHSHIYKRIFQLRLFNYYQKYKNIIDNWQRTSPHAQKIELKRNYTVGVGKYVENHPSKSQLVMSTKLFIY
jgi:hypothetical protein